MVWLAVCKAAKVRGCPYAHTSALPKSVQFYRGKSNLSVGTRKILLQVTNIQRNITVHSSGLEFWVWGSTDPTLAISG